MNRFHVLQCLSLALAVIISNIMCASVAYNYCCLQWSAVYEGSSAPPSVAFLFALPFLAGIILCMLSAWFFLKKSKHQGDPLP